MSFPSLQKFVLARPWLTRLVKPVANSYMNTCGYRQHGLLADDLYEEENETVKLALQRLTPKESYDRIYRIRRAVQVSLTQKLLPRDQWTKPEEDVPYLTTLIEEIAAAQKEKRDLENLRVIKTE